MLYYTEGTKRIPMDRLATAPYSNFHASICSLIPSISFLLSSLPIYTTVGCDSHVKTFVVDELFGLVDTIQTGMENNSLIL
jgi:hypothetical protein